MDVAYSNDACDVYIVNNCFLYGWEFGRIYITFSIQ